MLKKNIFEIIILTILNLCEINLCKVSFLTVHNIMYRSCLEYFFININTLMCLMNININAM